MKLKYIVLKRIIDEYICLHEEAKTDSTKGKIEAIVYSNIKINCQEESEQLKYINYWLEKTTR